MNYRERNEAGTSYCRINYAQLLRISALTMYYHSMEICDEALMVADFDVVEAKTLEFL